MSRSIPILEARLAAAIEALDQAEVLLAKNTEVCDLDELEQAESEVCRLSEALAAARQREQQLAQGRSALQGSKVVGSVRPTTSKPKSTAPRQVSGPLPPPPSSSGRIYYVLRPHQGGPAIAYGQAQALEALGGSWRNLPPAPEGFDTFECAANAIVEQYPTCKKPGLWLP